MQGMIRKDLVFIKCVIFGRLPTSELLYSAIPASHFIQIIPPNASSLTHLKKKHVIYSDNHIGDSYKQTL